MSQQAEATDPKEGDEGTPPADPPAAGAEDTGDDKGKGTTLLENDGGEKGAAHPADFPEDWAAKMAGDDEKFAKRLGRYASPKDLANAFKEAEQKISSGGHKEATPPPEDEEGLKAWREENGIPAEAAAYLENLPAGVVVGEDDKALFEAYAEEMHGQNAPPAYVQAAFGAFLKIKEDAITAQTEADETLRSETEEALRTDWGTDYKGNVNRVNSLLDTLPEGVKGMIQNARDSRDQVPLGSHPDFLRGMLALALEVNPAASVSSGTGTMTGTGIADEIKTIEGLMADPTSEYWKGPKAEGMQERYRKLIDAREAVGKKAA